MLSLQKWAKDKPLILKVAAPHLLTAVNDMHEEFKYLKQRRFASHKFPQPHLPSWFSMYRSHQRGIQHIKDVWTAVYGRDFVNLFGTMFEEAKALKLKKNTVDPSDPLTVEDYEILKDLVKALILNTDKELEEEVAQTPAKPAPQRRMARLIAEKPLESSFFLFVVVPCWMIYRIHPTRLYRQARLGDFESLKRLLMLDQLILHDPSIGKQVISYRFKHSASKYRQLIEAALKAPKGIDSRKNILLSQVGFIHALSQLTKKPLHTQDIYALVSAYDADFRTNFIDDLPDKYDALARLLRPDRNLWRQVLSSDKKM